MTKQERDRKFLERQAIRPLSPRLRVWGLLRFPFSPAVREHTIKCLLADPATREETIQQLGLDSAIRTPHSAFQ